MRARAIGVMRMVDQGQGDDKIVAVHINDPAFSDYTDISELPGHVAKEMRRFFEDYKSLEGKHVEVAQMEGAVRAQEILREALELYRKDESKLRGWGG
jgi:inorganic pyrophosphatase